VSLEGPAGEPKVMTGGDPALVPHIVREATAGAHRPKKVPTW
jgi:hypothetical protein